MCSTLDMKSTERLIRSGITYADLCTKLNSIPLIRIGPGYVLYSLADGTLRVPLHREDNAKVTDWEFEAQAKHTEIEKRFREYLEGGDLQSANSASKPKFVRSRKFQQHQKVVREISLDVERRHVASTVTASHNDE